MAKSIHELWHVPSGSWLEDFELEAEALAAVRGYLTANGPDMVHELVLDVVPADDDSGPSAAPFFLSGIDLAARLEQEGAVGGVAGSGMTGGAIGDG